MPSFAVDPNELAKHIAWLDVEATEQEQLVKALEPYSNASGTTTVGEVVAELRRTEPARARSLLRWAQSFVERGSSIASRCAYHIEYGHNEINKRTLALKRATWIPRAKMISGTQAFVTGSHSVDEDPAIADLRADAIAACLRTSLPASRTVTVKPHTCSAACQEGGDHLHMTRRVEVSIYTRPEWLAVGPVRHKAQSTRNAHREYSEIAARRPKSTESDPPRRLREHQSIFEAQDAEMEAQRGPLRALWRELQAYREQFKYDSIGTLVADLERSHPEKARWIVEQLLVVIDDPMTPPRLASLTNETLKFLPHTTDLESGQETEIADVLSEMNTHDGGTSVVLSGWHQKDEELALADRRAQSLLNYFKSLAHPNVWLKMQPHVCGDHCHQDSPFLRRIGWVDIRWQPHNVMLEDVRITAVTRAF
jgi:hypothetical protein